MILFEHEKKESVVRRVTHEPSREREKEQEDCIPHFEVQIRISTDAPHVRTLFSFPFSLFFIFLFI